MSMSTESPPCLLVQEDSDAVDLGAGRFSDVGHGRLHVPLAAGHELQAVVFQYSRGVIYWWHNAGIFSILSSDLVEYLPNTLTSFFSLTFLTFMLLPNPKFHLPTLFPSVGIVTNLFNFLIYSVLITLVRSVIANSLALNIDVLNDYDHCVLCSIKSS